MNFTNEYVQERIERAGATLQMLPNVPGPNSSCTFWPEMAREQIIYMQIDEGGKDVGLEIITPETRINRLKPTPRQIDELDQVLDWLADLGRYCHEKKLMRVWKVVGLGMLHHPVSGLRVHKWSQIARHLGASPRSVKRWYNDGVSRITEQQNLCAFKK